MPLNIKCPNCGEPDAVSGDAMYKRGRCNACRSIFFIKDAVQPIHPPSTAEPAAPTQRFTRLTKDYWSSLTDDQRYFAIVGVCIVAILVPVVLVLNFPTSDNESTSQALAQPQVQHESGAPHRPRDEALSVRRKPTPIIYPEGGSRDWSDTSDIETQDLWGAQIPTDPTLRRKYFRDMEAENERLQRELVRDGLLRE